MFDRRAALRFVYENALPGVGAFRYSALCDVATLYSSTYAVMTRSLLGALDEGAKAAWREMLCSFQQADGLFCDPVITDEGWYVGDPLWCGRPHLTSHVLTALTCLDGVAPKCIEFVRPWCDPDHLVHWLAGRNWAEDVSYTGNEIMNIGGLLQYERDFHGNERAGRAVQVLLEWLSTHHVNGATGLWGDLDPRDARNLSHMVQAAYHWWELFFYDGVAIPYPDRAVDSILRTQNPLGGFGQGVHNLEQPFYSSACEDIDSLAPLARLYARGVCRRDEVRRALERGRVWVEGNQTADGGFVFMKDRPFTYGHPQLHAGKGQGAMFPTWFRILTIALVSHALGDSSYRFTRCPGMQFM